MNIVSCTSSPAYRTQRVVAKDPSNRFQADGAVSADHGNELMVMPMTVVMNARGEAMTLVDGHCRGVQ